MAYRIHRKSINLKYKTLFQLLIVMLPFIEMISIFMAFNDSMNKLGTIIISLICMLGLFLYLSLHIISKPNATIPIKQNDFEPNLPDQTTNINDSTLECGPRGDQPSIIESVKSGDISKPDFTLKTRTTRQQSSPKPKQSSLPHRSPSRVGTPTNGRVTPSGGRKTPNNRNVSLNKSWEKRLNTSKTITISPKNIPSGKKQIPKKLPPVRQTKVRQMTETEVEKLKSKWNGKYNKEIGQNVETLEVKMTKEKIKSPLALK